ncbi:MBL fold metallo-hydrolase [Pseudomaricurvus alkylphenolicus]|jgi:ribonuclease Z|uniref:MBL fold metallo-hydrolase n=1 Tax=Pseudomaricurvus alkylphenolicus TaxID=1306991 RepID=UPI0014219F83|nr:MBL fold metallo-hydrolase [Pseudomaricurvus alkylphenolicus]NIB43695.1 MBL fold metallo-hydrolase [Pseudomaricurvus alkylphenolicus]
MKKYLFLLVSLGLTFLLSGCSPSSMGAFIMEKAAESRIGQSMTDDLEYGMHVILCGAGGPMPDPKRSGPCVAVIAGETVVTFDAGSGGPRNLAAMQFPLGKINAQFLTHFHSDHIDALGEMSMMRWVNAANTAPMPVYGPEGVENVVKGFNLSYGADAVYRHAHHTDLVAPLSGKGMVAHTFSAPAEGELLTVYEKDGLKISAFAVDHEPVHPAVGYRLDYKGRSVVISGDTAKSTNLERFSENVDLLVHESLNRKMVGIMEAAAKKNKVSIMEKILFDITDYHASPVEAAETAQAANAKHLMYYHIVPALVAPGMESLYLEGVSDVYDGPVTLGEDGTMISLPANSEAIKTENLL